MQSSFTRSLGKYGTLQIHNSQAAIHNSSDNPTFTFPTSLLIQAVSDYVRETKGKATDVVVHPYIKRALVNGVEIIPRIIKENTESYLTAINNHEAAQYIRFDVMDVPGNIYQNIILYRI